MSGDKRVPGPERRTSARHALPDAGGWFGAYGGRYVAETLVTPLAELERAYVEARADVGFQEELNESVLA